MTRFLRAALVFASLFFSVSAASAATLMLDRDGQLVGARGVTVGTALYDVVFFDGTCMQAFGKCSGPDQFYDANADLTFQSEAAAQLAAQALFDQVFLDGPQGAFDSQPSLTNGCENTATCYALIPFAFLEGGFLSAVMAVNNTADMAVQLDFGVSHDLSNIDSFTYARFTAAGAEAPSLSAVPLPAPVLFLLGGIGGLATLRRARRG